MKRSAVDPEWADEVIRRWRRRRNWPVERLGRDLWAVFEPALLWLDRQLRRWPWLYRHLGGSTVDKVPHRVTDSEQ